MGSIPTPVPTGGSMVIPASTVPHDQRMTAISNAIGILESLNPVDTPTQQMISVFQAVLQELVTIRLSIEMLPLPNEFKNLDS